MKVNSNIYRAGLIISFIAVNILIISGITSVISYLNTGAERSSMLHLNIDKEHPYQPQVNWYPFKNEGRPPEPQTIKELQKDYLNAWYIRNIAYLSNNKYGIKDYYTDSARVRLYHQLEYQLENDIHLESTTIKHHPELLFYSADGHMAVINDKGVERFERVVKGEEILLEVEEKNDYKSILLLEDGFWRIRHLVKGKNTYQKKPELTANELFIENAFLLRDTTSFNVKGINYYPAKTPWDLFGSGFDSIVLFQDFKLIQSAGLNSIRIFIPYEDFGKEQVKPEKLQKLKMLLDIAEQNQLKVVITLFDFYGDYSVLNWTITHRHAEHIVNSIKDHPALLAWDIKNEPDLDFDSRGKKVVLAWLKSIIKIIKDIDSSHPVTIGWSNPEAAINLKDEVDFISWHYYRDPTSIEEAYTKLKLEIPDKLLVLQEFGLSSYRGIWAPFGNSEKDQELYHQKMQHFIKNKELHFMSWTLYDFENIPKEVVGRWPWRKQKQKCFGFIGVDGTRKPSFKYISSD